MSRVADQGRANSPSPQHGGNAKHLPICYASNADNEAVGESNNSSGAPSRDQPPDRPNRRVVTLSLCAATNSCLLGYDIGVMGGAALFIQEDLSLSSVQVEGLVGSLSIAACVGALLAGKVSDQYGRTRTLRVAAGLFCVGALLMAVAADFALLMVGRLLTGIGVGFGLAIDPLYIAEISPPRFRGALVTFSETAINVGINLGYLSSFAFSFVPVGVAWRAMIAIGAVVPVFVVLLTLFVMPETPRWLIAQGRGDDARRVLEGVCDGPGEVDATFLSIQRHIQADGEIDRLGWAPVLRPTPGTRRALVAGVGVAVMQQVGGIEAVVYYTPIVLTNIGIERKSHVLGLNLALGVLKTSTIVVAACLLDKRAGRRSLLLLSTVGITVALLVIVVGLWSGTMAVVVSGLVFYVVAFSLGMGPVCWLFAAEVFPLQIRSRGMSLATTSNRVMSGVTSLSFLSLSDALGPAGAFGVLAGLSALSCVFVHAFVPETKGRSLEEMTGFFDELAARPRRPWRQFLARVVGGDKRAPQEHSALVSKTKSKQGD